MLLQCWVSTGCELPIIDVMAAIRAALNLGSVVIAAVAAFTVSAKEAGSVPWEPCKLESLVWWLKRFGAKSGEMRLSWESWGASCGSCCEEVLVALWVRSKVIVGNGAEAERVAKFCENGSVALSNMLGCRRPSELGIDPERSIDAAADVVDAIALAAGGSTWLCCPSYVVINTLWSSALLCTFKGALGQ